MDRYSTPISPLSPFTALQSAQHNTSMTPPPPPPHGMMYTQQHQQQHSLHPAAGMYLAPSHSPSPTTAMMMMMFPPVQHSQHHHHQHQQQQHGGQYHSMAHSMQQQQSVTAAAAPPEKVGDWIVHWFDEQRRSEWKLSVPQIKSCKKRKCQYTEDFEEIMYKSPYKYHLSLGIEGMKVAKDENVFAVMDLNYEDGSAVIYQPPERSKKQRSKKGQATSEVAERLRFRSSGAISNNEKEFQHNTDSLVSEVVVGPWQFNTCSYKQDNRKFRILVFVLSTAAADTICCLISPPLLIRAKKPIARPGLKKGRSKKATSGREGEKLGPAEDSIASTSSSSSVVSSILTDASSLSSTSSSPSTRKRKRPLQREEEMQNDQSNSGGSDTVASSQAATPQSELLSYANMFPFGVDNGDNSVIITGDGNTNITSGSSLACGNDVQGDQASKRMRFFDGEMSPTTALFGTNGVSSCSSSSSSSSSSGSGIIGHDPSGIPPHLFEEYLSNLESSSAIIEQQRQALHSMHTIIASGEIAQSKPDWKDKQTVSRDSSAEGNNRQQHMTGEEKIRSAMDLFNDMHDNDRRRMLGMIVESLSNVEREFMARKYFGASISSVTTTSASASYTSFGGPHMFISDSASGSDGTLNTPTADPSLDQLFDMFFS